MVERKEHVEIIAVDFDGTLCRDEFPGIGEANITLIRTLLVWKKQGKRLVLWTCRCGDALREAVLWCAQFGLEFDAVNENVAEVLERYGTESRKITADLYIDDRAVRFEELR